MIYSSIITLVISSLAAALPTQKQTPGIVEFNLHKSEKHAIDAIKAPILKDGSKTIQTKLINKQFYYQIQLGIGNPAQLVDFTIDTGSSDLWVMAASNPYCTTNPLNETGINCTNSVFDPLKSSTFLELDSPFEIVYGDHTTANGKMASDTVRIGDSAVLNATFAVANVVNSSTCVFGIGFIGNEAEAHIHRNGSGVYPTYFNIPTLMKEQELITTNAYSLWLNDYRSDEGNILFGGIDRAKFDGDLVVVPIFNNYHEFTDRPIQTRVMLNSLSVDRTPLVDFEIAVLLDSGTSFSYLPKQIVEALGNAVGFLYDEDVGYYFGSVDAARSNVQTISLNFSGANIDVPIDNLLVELTMEDGKTPLVIGGDPQAILAVSPAESDYMYILGDVFLHSMYAVFDIDHYEIALAQAKFNVTDSDIVTIGASIPGAIQAPNYARTFPNNASYNMHPFTPATPPPEVITIDLGGSINFTAVATTVGNTLTTLHAIATVKSSKSQSGIPTMTATNSTSRTPTSRISLLKSMETTSSPTATPCFSRSTISRHHRHYTASTSTTKPIDWVLTGDGELVPVREHDGQPKNNRKVGQKAGKENDKPCDTVQGFLQNFGF